MIYQYKNKLTNQRYIGITDDLYGKFGRDYQHIKSSEYNPKTHFHRNLRKYGRKNFELTILDERYNFDLEEYYIKKLKPELNMTKGGNGGWIHDQTGNTWKIKDTSNMKGWKNHDTLIPKISGGNNYQSKYYIHTPWGIFETWKDCMKEGKRLKKEGRKDIITDVNTIRKYCLQDIILNKEGRRTYPDWRGKSTREIGFKVIEK